MLGYSYIEWKGPVPVPERAVNGGLYTGESFHKNAPWANVPVEPDAVALAHNLRSANPPPRAAEMLPSYSRPGNNLVASPFHQVYHEAFPNIKVQQ